MIPKIIHLCWFGGNEYPALVKKCVSSWEEKLPDYEIKKWDESSFPVNDYPFTREAYSQKKWAFVSDYVRLVALYEYGGVYMDTDLEVIRDFSSLLVEESFVSSRIEGELITAGFIAAEPKHPFIKALIKYYESKMIDRAGNTTFVMNPLVFTRVAMDAYSFPLNKKSFRNGDMVIYSLDYFMPYHKNMISKRPYSQSNYHITENTYAIHHDMGSWGHQSKTKRAIKGLIRLVIPEPFYRRLKRKKFERVLGKQ